MSEAIDPKEAKTLSDILALVLDDQAGSAAAALLKLRQRAASDRVTAGALKNLFVRLADVHAPLPDRSASDVAALREVLADQASTIRQLQQQVRLARSELARAVERESEIGEAESGRRALLVVGLVGAATVGLVVAGGVGWWLGRTPPVRVAAAPRVVPSPPGAVTIVPPVRDPADTAPGPDYPLDAKRKGEQGTVALLVHLDADGHVSGIGVAESAGADLDVAAQQAVREWHFHPELRDGKPVASQIMLRFTFVLKAQ